MTDQERVERKRWIFVSIGIIATGVMGLLLMGALRPEPQLKPPQQRAAFVTGTPITWRSDGFEIEGQGRVAAFDMVRLQAQINGDVTFVSEQLQPGGRFAKGDHLLTINPAPFAARRAELAAQLTSAQADLALAKTQATRARQLLDRRAAAQEEVDQRDAAVTATLARIEQIKASLDSADIELARSKIRAPFDGRVQSETVSVGDVLAPGVVFAEIYANHVFEIPVALPESDAALVGDLFVDDELNIPARVVIEYGGARFAWRGRVHRVEPGLDRTARTVDLLIHVDKPEQRGRPLEATQVAAPPLLLGAFATVYLPSRDVGDFVELPRNALRTDDTVWYVDADEDGTGTVEVASARVLKTNESVAYVQPNIPADANLLALDPTAGSVMPGSRVTVSTGAATSAATVSTADPARNSSP